MAIGITRLPLSPPNADCHHLDFEVATQPRGRRAVIINIKPALDRLKARSTVTGLSSPSRARRHTLKEGPRLTVCNHAKASAWLRGKWMLHVSGCGSLAP